MGQFESIILTALQKVIHFNDQYVGILDSVHEHIHEGRFFTLSFSFSKNNGQNADFVFTFPNDTNKEYHFYAVFSSLGAGTVTLYDSPTVGAGGSAGTFSNNNDLSSNVTDVTAKSDPTISDVGTMKEQLQVGSAGVSVMALGGGNGATRAEWVTRNKTFLLRYASTTNSNLIILTVHYYFKPV